MKIKMLLLCSFALCFVVALNAQAEEAKAPVVKGGKNGIYFQRVPVEGMSAGDVWYSADVQAKLCYAWWTGGLTSIPCNFLANRSEWKKIITWNE